MELSYKVKSNDITINQILKENLDFSSKLLYKCIKNNCILKNGLSCDTRDYAKADDVISINFDYSEDNSNIVSTNMKLNIIFEDEWILVIDKPAGIPVHPSVLHFSDSLCNGVRFYFDSINLHKKIRPVNRLDLNTSGLVIFAKCEYIQESLIKQMASHTFKKEYIAICEGIFNKKIGTIDKPIDRKPDSIIERCISENGQKAITHYTVLKEFDNYSLVKCLLETGRTHQIRVHMASILHPLLGDTLYNCSSNLIDRQALHCYNLSFIHPIYKKNICLYANIPDDFKKILE